jgi:dipeptidyl aminopeptidase/acylaminoacyl peptidase
MRAWGLTVVVLVLACPAHAADAPTPAPSRFTPQDLAHLVDLTEPAFSPDGRAIVYTATSANRADDKSQSDLWRVDFDGSHRVRLTNTPKFAESRPQWSPDGKSIAFLSDRGGEDADTQVWLMPANGGEAKRLTKFGASISDFAWSPDGKRIAFIGRDPERPFGAKKPKQPPPIVTERYQFREDGTGYLDSRRNHVYVLDIATGKTDLLTPGAHDEQLLTWSPDGKLLAYVTKRGVDPDRHLNYDIYVVEPKAGAKERQLTTFTGSDLDPYWETRPTFSPDSTQIAYLRSGEDKWIYYTPWQLAIVDVATGKERIPADIDRCFTKPRWAPDGKSVYALVEQNLVTLLSRIDLADGKVTPLTRGPRFDYDLDVAHDGRIVVLGGDDLHPYQISAVEPEGLRTLADHNEFLAKRQLAPAEVFHYTRDGVDLEGLIVKPLDYVEGRRYPTIVRLHGGPVYQYSREFMPDWQVYAANGFVVVALNPRGGSGRGFDFAKAIYADWGNVDAKDVLAGVDHVVQMGIADPDRLGIGGWSYGAILTNAVIASDTRFKAAVSGAGASNMYGMFGHDQYVREYTLELGTPWANREAYDRASFPFLHADRITTPTMFQCGEADANVPCLGAEQTYQALRARNVPTVLVVYPGESHGLTVPSYLEDRMMRNLAWYTRYLKGTEPEGAK